MCRLPHTFCWVERSRTFGSHQSHDVFNTTSKHKQERLLWRHAGTSACGYWLLLLWVLVNIHETESVHLFENLHLICVCGQHLFVFACFLLMCSSAHLVCVWVFGCACAAQRMLSTVWPSLVLPAVLTLVCVDSKHSCRSQRPRSGRTWGSEGQWGREHTGSIECRNGKVHLEGWMCG